MNKIFMVIEGYTFLRNEGGLEECFMNRKAFSNEHDAIEEAKKTFLIRLRNFFESERSEYDNAFFKDFDDFFKKCSKETYYNENSELNKFFVDFCEGHYYFGFEDDKLAEKPDFLVKVEQYYIY